QPGARPGELPIPTTAYLTQPLNVLVKCMGQYAFRLIPITFWMNQVVKVIGRRLGRVSLMKRKQGMAQTRLVPIAAVQADTLRKSQRKPLRQKFLCQGNFSGNILLLTQLGRDGLGYLTRIRKAVNLFGGEGHAEALLRG